MSDSFAQNEHAFSVLSQSPLFGDMDTALLKSFIAHCSHIVWNKSMMLDSDIATRYFHIIVDGRLKLMQMDPRSGRTVTLFLLGSGDAYDIFTLLDGEEHTVFPVAVDQVHALRMPLDEARAWLHAHPELNRQFFPYLGHMLRHLENFCESMIFDDTATRLSKLILRHTVPQKHPDLPHYPVRLIHNLSHEALAEMIGSVRSVVSSQMHKLKEQNIIHSSRGHLAVKDLQALIKKSDEFADCIDEQRRNASGRQP